MGLGYYCVGHIDSIGHRMDMLFVCCQGSVWFRNYKPNILHWTLALIMILGLLYTYSRNVLFLSVVYEKRSLVTDYFDEVQFDSLCFLDPTIHVTSPASVAQIMTCVTHV